MKNKKGLTVFTEQMLSYEYWEIHEAAYLLSGNWPEYTVATSIFGITAERINRTFIYIDGDSLTQDTFKSNTKKILQLLKDTIEINDELLADAMNLSLSAYYGKKMSYVLHSNSVITWAFRKGIIFPPKLQSIFRIYQLDIRVTNTLKKIVATQTIAQYLLNIYPHMNISQICHHELMEKIGPRSLDNEKKAIRRAIHKIFNIKRKRGRPPKKYTFFKKITLNPIPEVFQVKSENIHMYSIPLMEVVISIITKIHIYTKGEEFKHLTEIEFIKKIFGFKIIELYLKNASLILQDLLFLL